MSRQQQEYTPYAGRGKTHEGPDHSAPYPVSRLAPAISLVDIASEIERADTLLASHAEGRLEVIARQIRALQDEARTILEKARRDQELHRAEKSFQVRPGHVYHLYRRSDATLVWSLLSPADWKGRPPHAYVGSYRLEADMGWTEVETGI
ncbi:hypothetical protein GF1_00110 [Desulfolithobacter dissulfuricans]|uniref:DUF2452 domain-containing protein n=1 Tax=Desulfolithobacter dissulfuricans TaxID=2795293 RepID=A0A915TYP1_9BACT|nr:DUF2452 domain-containing protein [Desulfolithobacter dissulfuricans]BCO07635.1 hypothetical protein GF1_00110 [Desulfolithobacter dissulfuricans]